MTEKPLVSIVIPLYNGSNYVEQALQSALAQTYDRIEIIVVNDGSTDAGAGKAICDKYSEQIVYLEKENGGCASALNFGIKHANGQLISWLSHDDLYDAEKVAYQVALYRKHGLDMQNTIISNIGGLIDAEGNKIVHPKRKAKGLYTPEQAFSFFLFGACPNGCGLLIPKSCFERYGYFDESLRFVLDWNLWMKFASSGVSFYLDDKQLVSNRVHSMQVTTKHKELHSRETNITVDQLFSMLCQRQGAAYYLRELYYFACTCGWGDKNQIREYIKENGIKISTLKQIMLAMKSGVKRFLKKIYHMIR